MNGRRHIRVFCMLMLGFCWWAGRPSYSPAAYPPRDRVEALRQALQTNIFDPKNRVELEYRQKLLEKRAAALKVGDLRRALALQDWRDEGREIAIAAIDKPVRDGLVKRLEDDLRVRLKSGNTASKLAAIAQVWAMGVRVRGTRSGVPLSSNLAPDLVSLLQSNDPDVQEAAALALGKVVPSAPQISAIGDLLTSGNIEVRLAAGKALQETLEIVEPLTRPASGGAAEIEISSRQAADVGQAVGQPAAKGIVVDVAGVQRHCLKAIELGGNLLYELTGDTSRQEEQRFPPLDRKLTPDEIERIKLYRQAVESERQALRPLALALQAQVPAVSRMLADNDADIRYLATQALVKIGLARQRILRKIRSIPMLPPEGGARGTGRLPEMAFIALQAKADPDTLGAAMLDAIPEISARLSDPDVKIRRATLDILDSLSAEAMIAEAVPTVVRALGDRDRFVRWAAARMLGHVAAASPTVEQLDQRVPPQTTVPALARLMINESDLDVQLAVTTALERFGPSASAATGALTRQAGRGDPEIRVGAIEALEMIGLATPDAVAALAAGLRHPDDRVRLAAAHACGTFGPAARAAIPALEQALEDPEEEVHQAASDALLAVTAK